ncbi:hypothetical protein [Hydrogenimonas sp.]
MNNNKKTILVSAQNKEEYEEILEILSWVDRKNKNLRYVFFDSSLFYKTKFLKSNLFEKNYQFIPQNSILDPLRLCLSFYKVIKIEKPDFLLSGGTLFFHRIALFLNRYKVTHVGYSRGLLVDPKNIVSTSDAIYFLLRSLHISARLFNNYYADQILSIGETNTKFLSYRGIKTNNIFNIGKVGKVTKIDPLPINRKILIFVTQAFEHHNDTKSQKDQISFLKSLIESSNGFKIIIRPHPRDNFDYRIFQTEHVSVDRGNKKEFIANNINGILISTLSTFAFEWMQFGGKVVFYCYGNLKLKYAGWFGKYLAYMPYDSTKLLINDINDSNTIQEIFDHSADSLKRVYSDIDEHQKKSIINNIFCPCS